MLRSATSPMAASARSIDTGFSTKTGFPASAACTRSSMCVLVEEQIGMHFADAPDSEYTNPNIGHDLALADRTERDRRYAEIASAYDALVVVDY